MSKIDHIRTAAALLDDPRVTRDIPRSVRYGNRRVSTMRQTWDAHRKAVSSGDPDAIQDTFDMIEPWVDWCFGRAANEGDA